MSERELHWDEVAEAVKVPHKRLGLMVSVTTFDGRRYELTEAEFAQLVIVAAAQTRGAS